MKLLSVTLLLTLAFCAVADPSPTLPKWAEHALAFQRKLAYKLPLSKVSYPGTHNSFNYVDSGSSPIGEQKPNQLYPLDVQLKLGMRRVEIDTAYIWQLNGFVSADGLSATGGIWDALNPFGPAIPSPLSPSQASEFLRHCHLDPDSGAQALLFCTVANPAACAPGGLLPSGVPNYGVKTLCTPAAPKLTDSLQIIKTFLQQNDKEVLIVYFNENFVDIVDIQGATPVLQPNPYATVAFEAAIRQYFPLGWILTPDVKNKVFKGVWPSPSEMIARGYRVVLQVDSETSRSSPKGLSFLKSEIVPDDFDIGVHEFIPQNCTTQSFQNAGRINLPVDFTYVKGDASYFAILDLVIDGSDGGINIVTPAVTNQAENCGFSPIFDNVEAGLASSASFTFDNTLPLSVIQSDSAADNACVALFPNVAWRVQSCNTARPLLCKQAGSDGFSPDHWRISSSVLFPTSNGRAKQACPNGFDFGVPVQSLQNAIVGRKFASTSAGIWLNVDLKADPKVGPGSNPDEDSPKYYDLIGGLCGAAVVGVGIMGVRSRLLKKKRKEEEERKCKSQNQVESAAENSVVKSSSASDALEGVELQSGSSQSTSSEKVDFEQLQNVQRLYELTVEARGEATQGEQV